MNNGSGGGSAHTGRARRSGAWPPPSSPTSTTRDLARVKLKFPWLSDDYESEWARVAQLGAGHHRGAVWLPEVNDEVLVAFEHGDTRRPFVVGELYNGVDSPLGDGLVDGPPAP